MWWLKSLKDETANLTTLYYALGFHSNVQMFDEKEALLTKYTSDTYFQSTSTSEFICLRFSSVGSRFSSGFASSYSNKFVLDVFDSCYSVTKVWPYRYTCLNEGINGDLENIRLLIHQALPEEEIIDIISRLNDSIQTFWPCSFCFNFGLVWIILLL